MNTANPQILMSVLKGLRNLFEDLLSVTLNKSSNILMLPDIEMKLIFALLKAKSMIETVTPSPAI